MLAVIHLSSPNTCLTSCSNLLLWGGGICIGRQVITLNAMTQCITSFNQSLVPCWKFLTHWHTHGNRKPCSLTVYALFCEVIKKTKHWGLSQVKSASRYVSAYWVLLGFPSKTSWVIHPGMSMSVTQQLYLPTLWHCNSCLGYEELYPILILFLKRCFLSCFSLYLLLHAWTWEMVCHLLSLPTQDYKWFVVICGCKSATDWRPVWGEPRLSPGIWQPGLDSVFFFNKLLISKGSNICS